LFEMIFKRIKSEGISANSYLVGSGGNAIIVDPRRDCEIYLDIAKQENLTINHIFETHRHEDFAIGSIELAHLTQATIYHGPGLQWGYGVTVQDAQTFFVGHLKLTVLHTPGHTDESVSYVVTDLATGGSPVMVFTGDALFVNDVGRTDLYGENQVSRLAENLFNSIFNRLLPLGDGVIICPAHGGGSICGMRIAGRDESSIGIERMQNPVLRMTKKEDFVKYKMSEHAEKPPYFKRIEQDNLNGPRLLGNLPVPPSLTAGEFNDKINDGSVVLDTRDPSSFGGAHIPRAYSIWLDGLPSFAGWVLPYDQPLVLVVENEQYLEKAVRYLMREGYDNYAGYLKGNIDSWYIAGLPIETLKLISVKDLKAILDRKKDVTLLDVRGQKEWEAGHIEEAIHIFVGHLIDKLSQIPKEKPTVVHCSAGYRSGLAASLLLRAGYTEVYNVAGGIDGWLASGLPIIRG
jgi:hydroxyacylglutathione hydrolase